MTRKSPLALLIVLCAAAPLPALAQSQTAMNASAARDARAADDALNAQYRTTTARLSPGSRALLRDAQRSWLTFRDKQCRYESSAVQGGSAAPMVQSGCLKRLTQDRTRQLRTYAQCEEGDLSCPR